jgi:hypothetical protein
MSKKNKIELTPTYWEKLNKELKDKATAMDISEWYLI